MKYHQYLKIKENLDLKINYLNAIWKYFEWEKVNFVRWRENILKAQNRAVTDEQLNKHEMVIGQLYPHLFLSSNLTQLYTIFETKLGDVCYWAQHMNSIELTEDEKTKLKRSKDNFEMLKCTLKHMDISLKELDNEYQEIKLFQKLRNSIAHNGDRIVLSNPEDENFRNFVSRMDGIMIQNSFWVQEGGLDFYLMISDYPNKRFYNLCLDFFEKLLDLLFPNEEKLSKN